jgi:hypothetical protein
MIVFLIKGVIPHKLLKASVKPTGVTVQSFFVQKLEGPVAIWTAIPDDKNFCC